LLGLLLAAAMAPSTALAGAPGCQGANVPVTTLLVAATMHGTLCMPSTGTPSTVIVLVPGATYDSAYWDFSYKPSIYDFGAAMNAAGYATFAVDSLGTGQSSRPPSVLVTTLVQAIAVHDVIQALRNGEVGGVRFTKVILGGHSLGSAAAILEAGTYNDENALLLTGISHQANFGGFGALLTSLYPATLDPRFAGRTNDPGYLTTRPGTRAGLFYSPATTDPAIVALDEATKEVVSTGEVADAVLASFSPYSDLIKSPVLIVDGQNDRFFCSPLTGNCRGAAALRNSEAPFYAATACLEAYVLPGAGHDVNLATDTQNYQRAARSWADTFVGPSPTPPLGRCPRSDGIGRRARR
jgi:pimeloyl-ACP methyl ester carboxylesterase